MPPVSAPPDTTWDPTLEQLGVNVIRGLAMDAPQRADSGHPGTAMALAPLAHVLWTRIMSYDAADPFWPDRDRFVLSNGHACILQYAMLHLTGYPMTLDDLRQFRQWDSATPGHPERERTAGIEVTTGPLGQGFANGVGMGVAERFLRARFGPELCDHHTFVIAGDGCLEEGISHEAASLAGHLGLGRLVYIYDDNHITIDGPTSLSYSDDVAGRFSAYGWHVDDIGDVANDLDRIESALRAAMAEEDRPSLVMLRSHIGWPSPHKTDTAAAHGSPLGADEIRATKEVLGLPPDQAFYVPDAVLAAYRAAGRRGRAAHEAWERRAAGLGEARAAWDAAQAGRGLPGWAEALPSFEPGTSVATRKAINLCLHATADGLPGLVLGSADLTGNTGVALEDGIRQSREHPESRQVYFGIREHAMGGMMNGMAHHGGVLPIGGTFFVFSDYMRGSVRLAALSEAHVIYSWTHDSIGLGEDGPTHQPIEQLAAVRAMPGLQVIRPADANECARALEVAVATPGPTALILSRQEVPVLDGTAMLAADGVARGAYVLVEVDGGHPDVILIGTGSEVQLCVDAARALGDGGVRAQVVSLPCWERFEAQDAGYREQVLPGGVPCLAVEAASSFGWDRYADATVCIDRFGASAPGPVAMEHFGFTAAHVATVARRLVAERSPADHERRSR